MFTTNKIFREKLETMTRSGLGSYLEPVKDRNHQLTTDAKCICDSTLCYKLRMMQYQRNYRFCRLLSPTCLKKENQYRCKLINRTNIALHILHTFAFILLPLFLLVIECTVALLHYFSRCVPLVGAGGGS